MKTNKWDIRFLNRAKEVADWSKDPSTQCGAVIIRSNRTEAASGFNGFPRKIKDTPKLLNNREEKYKRIIHADMNAILTCHEDMEGYTMYTWPFLPCHRCCVNIIQVGITRVVAPAQSADIKSRWADSVKLSKALFKEARIKYKEYQPWELNQGLENESSGFLSRSMGYLWKTRRGRAHRTSTTSTDGLS